MTIPDYESLMPRVLSLARQERSIREAVGQVSDDLGLTDEERQIEIPSGTKTLIKSRLEWAVTYLVHAGLLERPRRGHFLITERGRKVLAEDTDKLDGKYLRKFPEFADFIARRRPELREGRVTTSTQEAAATPEEQIGEAYTALEGELRSELLRRVLVQSPSFFEDLVITLLSAMGYGDHRALSKAIGKVGDGGIDGIIHQDKLGLDVIYLQAKRYGPENSVGRPELQAFVGALSGISAQKGVFVTTSRFTPTALEYLRTVQQRVVTVDGERLVDLMVQHGVGIRSRQVLELHRVDEDFFIEE